jgi:hypothetical protein
MAGGPEDCRTISLDGLNVARTSLLPAVLSFRFEAREALAVKRRGLAIKLVAFGELA